MSERDMVILHATMLMGDWTGYDFGIDFLQLRQGDRVI